jgi:acyl-CoA thioesterase I
MLVGACKEGAFMLKLLARYGVMLTIIQGLSACGQSPVANAPAKTENAAPQAQFDKLVVAFGDSLYAGYGLEPGEGLAPQLQAALQAKGVNARVHNAGVSGDTTAAGKQRLTFVLNNLEKKPDLVILGLGGNDMLRGIEPKQTRENLIAMLDELKKRDIDVVLTGMLASPNMGADYAKGFNPIYAELSNRYDTSLMPFLLDGIVTERVLMLDDGIHPNKRGIVRIIEKLTPLVERELNSG